MTLQQKMAWYNLSVALLAIITYFALLPVLGPWRATGAFGILGFAGFSVFFYFLEKRKGGVLGDERDQSINRQAYIIAKSSVWVVLFAAFGIMATYMGDDGFVSVRSLGFVVWWIFAGYLVIYSVATLILYARH